MISHFPAKLSIILKHHAGETLTAPRQLILSAMWGEALLYTVTGITAISSTTYVAVPLIAFSMRMPRRNEQYK